MPNGILYANQIVIDFDMSDLLPAQRPGDRFWAENPKLIDGLMPKKADGIFQNSSKKQWSCPRHMILT